MAISKIGGTSTTRSPIVFPNVPYANITTVSNMVYTAKMNRTVPAGWWEIQTTVSSYLTQVTGTGPSVSAEAAPTQIRFYSVTTKKPVYAAVLGSIYSNNDGPLFLPEECFFEISNPQTTAAAKVDITFYPLTLPFAYEGVASHFTASDTPMTAANTGITTLPTITNAQLAMNYEFAGYDYDNNTLAIITFTNTSVPTASYAISSTIQVRRQVAGTAKYANKVSITMSATNSWWSAVWSAGVVGVDLGYGQPSFFIKNNLLHILSPTPIYHDGTTASGWITLDCSSSGTKTMALGNSNAAFNAPVGSLQSSISGNSYYFGYHHDAVNKKVICLGYSNTNTDATGWTAMWAQWDIPSNTNNYTTSLGSRHRFFASSNLYPQALAAWSPNGATLRANAICTNSTIVLAGMFNQANTVNTTQANANLFFYADNNPGSAPAGSVNSTFGKASFVSPAGTFYGGTTENGPIRWASTELGLATDATSVGAAYGTFTSVNNKLGYYVMNGGANSSIGSTNSNFGFYITADKIYIIRPTFAIGAFSNGASARNTGNIVTTIHSLPMTENNLLYILSFQGGIKSATSAFNIY